MADERAEYKMKVEALKKAYAEVILNTSKEAAARVMVLEQRSFRFQKDLASLKDEALHMLLRLKQACDSKITEAEKKSLNQQRKIDELEAQLSEAEGIVVDLRYELRQVHDELEKVNQSPKQPESEHVVECVSADDIISHTALNMCLEADTKPTTVDSDVKSIPQSEILSSSNCRDVTNCVQSSAKLDLNGFCHGKPNFTSMIIQSRGTELYRNGCTQRIRAFDGNLLGEKYRKTDKNQSNVEGEGIQCHVTENAYGTKNAEIMHNDQQKHTIKACSKRKIRKNCRRLTLTSQEPSLLSHSKGHVETVHNDVESSQDPYIVRSAQTHELDKNTTNGSEEKLQDGSHCYKNQATLAVCTRSNRKNAKYREAIAALRRSSHRKHTKPCQPTPLSEYKAFQSGGNFKSVEAAESLKASTSNSDSFGNDAPLVDSELVDAQISEGTECIYGKPNNDRHVKFTFQRKRKNEVLQNLDQNVESESITVKRRELEK